MLFPLKFIIYFSISFAILSIPVQNKTLFEIINQSIVPLVKNSQNVWLTLVESSEVEQKEQMLEDLIQVKSSGSEKDHPQSMDDISDQEKKELEKLFR